MSWVENNLPEGVDEEDFVNGLAYGAIQLINHASEVQGVAVSVILASMSENFNLH